MAAVVITAGGSRPEALSARKATERGGAAVQAAPPATIQTVPASRPEARDGSISVLVDQPREFVPREAR